VLSTYSAQTGGLLKDSVRAKFIGTHTKAGTAQTNMMLDAVRNKTPKTFVAHSRGSILSKDAWHKVHETRKQEILDADPEYASLPWWNISAKWSAEKEAGQQATTELNRYVRVIDAGNAVWADNSGANTYHIVNPWDPVPNLVGSLALKNLISGAAALVSEPAVGPGLGTATGIAVHNALVKSNKHTLVLDAKRPPVSDILSAHDFDASYAKAAGAASCQQPFDFDISKVKGFEGGETGKAREGSGGEGSW